MAEERTSRRHGPDQLWRIRTEIEMMMMISCEKTEEDESIIEFKNWEIKDKRKGFRIYLRVKSTMDRR